MSESNTTEGTASAFPTVLILGILWQRQLDSLQLYLFLRSSRFSFFKAQHKNWKEPAVCVASGWVEEKLLGQDCICRVEVA